MGHVMYLSHSFPGKMTSEMFATEFHLEKGLLIISNLTPGGHYETTYPLCRPLNTHTHREGVERGVSVCCVLMGALNTCYFMILLVTQHATVRRGEGGWQRRGSGKQREVELCVCEYASISYAERGSTSALPATGAKNTPPASKQVQSN